MGIGKGSGGSEKPRVMIFDTEANGLLDTVDRCWCGVFTSLDGKDVHKFGPVNSRGMLEFMDSCDVLIGHNVIGYDFPMLKKVYGYEYKGKVVDTLIMSRVLDPNRRVPPTAQIKTGPHSIYAWGLRIGVDKPEHDEWDKFSPEMLHRCAEDAEINRRVYHLLMEEAKGGDWKNAFLLSFKLFQNLQEQEDYGWMVDRELMRKHIATLTDMIHEIEKQLEPILPYIVQIDESKKDGEYGYVRKPFLKSGKPDARSVVPWLHSANLPLDGSSIGGVFSRISFRKLDLGSRNECVEYLLNAGWEPLEWNTDDNGKRTSPKLSKIDPFEGVEGESGKLMSKFFQCRHRRSLIEGLLELTRDDQRIASSVNTIAVTGRATHRNIVNIPAAKSFFGKECREIFIAAPGKILVSTDSDGNQLRQLAARMGDASYIDALCNGDKANGTDLHSINMRAAGLPDRDTAKTFIYGFLFGAGDAKIGKIVGGNASRGKQLKEQFLKGLPALGDLLSSLKQEWRSTAKKKYNSQFNRMEYYNGIIKGLDGRPIVVPSEHAVLVYLLQSDEAVQMSAAYNWTIAQLKKRFNYGVQVNAVCWYHDEYTFECDPDIAEEVKAISEEGIAWAGRFYGIKCPHVGQGKIGSNWYEVH